MSLELDHNQKKKKLQIVIIWTISAIIFFRNIFANFNYSFGDDGDGRFIPILSSHWSELNRNTIFDRTSFFYYPQNFVIGYSDFLLGFAPINPISFILSLDIFRSLIIYVLVLSFISLLGVIKLIEYFQQKPVNLFQMVISTIAIFGNGFSVSASTHSQLFAFFAFPWLFYFFLRKDSLKFGFFFGILLSIIFLTSIYTFIFSLLFFVIFYILNLKANDFKYLLSSIITFLISSSLGIYYYFQVYKSMGPRSVEDLIGNIPPIFNLFNVSETNILWGRLVTKYGALFGSGFQNHEYALAVTPILFISTLIFVFRKVNFNTETKILFIGIFFQLLTIKIFNFSLWSLFIEIPGFDVIRVIGRIQIFSHFLIALALALALPKLNIKNLYIAILVSIIFIENLNSGMVNQVNVAQQEKLINFGKNKLQECEVFFAISSNFDRPNFAHQVDAMVISYGAKIPTLNGYSGNQPPNWELGNIQFPDYADRLINWINFKNIDKTICQVDVETGKWKKVNFKLS